MQACKWMIRPSLRSWYEMSRKWGMVQTALDQPTLNPRYGDLQQREVAQGLDAAYVYLGTLGLAFVNGMYMVPLLFQRADNTRFLLFPNYSAFDVNLRVPVNEGHSLFDILDQERIVADRTDYMRAFDSYMIFNANASLAPVVTSAMSFDSAPRAAQNLAGLGFM